MRSGFLLPASLLAAALALSLAAPAHADILVDIDKNTQSMTVTVDGQQRYVWPVSTGRPGYDTPNGSFKINRMDADHLSQEWDNAPMPHTMFFDLRGHAIHGFFDVGHLGSAVSHGCVRLSPDNAATLFGLVTTEGMNATRVSISGQTPARRAPEVARRAVPVEQAVAGAPMEIAPGYGYERQPAVYQPQSPPYGAPVYRPQPQPSTALQPQPYEQAQPYAPRQQLRPQPYLPAQPPPVAADPNDQPANYRQGYYRPAQPYGQQPYYGQPAAQPQQYYVVQPYGRY